MKIFFIVRVWMMVNTITTLIFANYLLGMNENQTSISKSHANNTPFIAIKMKNKRKETIKEKGKIHTQK
jgi:hypothetical protein